MAEGIFIPAAPLVREMYINMYTNWEFFFHVIDSNYSALKIQI